MAWVRHFLYTKDERKGEPEASVGILSATLYPTEKSILIEENQAETDGESMQRRQTSLEFDAEIAYP